MNDNWPFIPQQNESALQQRHDYTFYDNCKYIHVGKINLDDKQK